MRCSLLSHRRRFSLLAVAPSTIMASRPHFRGGHSNRSGLSDPGQTRGRGRGDGALENRAESHPRPFNPNRNQHNQFRYPPAEDQIRQAFQLPRPVVQEQNLGFRHENRARFHSRPANPSNAHYNQPNQFRYPPPEAQIRNAFQPPQQQFRPKKPLDFRNWEYAKKTKAPPSSERFIVISYNILADYLAIDHWSKLYFHIPRHMLDWQWRKKNIMFELGLWSADIMCFQEVDRFNDLDEELKRRGYLGLWKMRTGNAVDGCAIFWRTSRFKMVHEESIEFNKLGLRDNVAQICVLELTSKKNTQNTAAESLTSSKDANKVVVCNIHVLYNPKRGEIKLGQVRMLLDRAYAVSKLWDDAPLVLCGDFNCTPKSPLYNYISEQKIDLSDVDRDKLSGQASAEIRPQRHYNHNSRNQSGDSSIQPPSALERREVAIDATISVANSEEHHTSDKHNAVTPRTSSQYQYDAKTIHTDAQCGNERSALCAELRNETPQNVVDGYKVDQGNKEVLKFIPPASPHTEDVPASLLNHGSSECSPNCTSVTDSFNSVIESSDRLCKSANFDCLEVYSHSSPEKVSPQSDRDNEQDYSSIPCKVDVFDETIGSLSLNEQYGDKILGEGIEEDDHTFLSALHGNKDAQVQSPSYEVLNGFSSGFGSEAMSYKRTFYNPSVWTPEEIETATGKPDCTILEHPVKLRSTYTEVEDCSGTRDSSGEPMVTSYNRCFLGTVDYIWYSEGLQTARVLAPIPKHVMQQTPGFPTKKWGSDHIALASELAFVKRDQQ